MLDASIDYARYARYDAVQLERMGHSALKLWACLKPSRFGEQDYPETREGDQEFLAAVKRANTAYDDLFPEKAKQYKCRRAGRYLTPRGRLFGRLLPE